MDALRKCLRCGLEAHTEDDLDLFIRNKDMKHGRQNTCKECRNKKRKQNDSYSCEQKKVYNRDRHLRVTYGITYEGKVALYADQNGKCFLCEEPMDFSVGTNCVVEHCHCGCGTVRGLAHMACNIIIGKACDDADLLRRIADNLERKQSEIHEREVA